MEEWNRKLAAVKIRKQDMNNLIMNYLVTEVLAASHVSSVMKLTGCKMQ